MTEIKVPEISERMDLSMDEAKKEYSWLKSLLIPGTPNAPRYGWSSWVVNKIESRITTIETIITNICMKE